MTSSTPNRRRFLKAAGLTVALPLLESFAPVALAASAQAPRRMIAICNALGPYPDYFFPEKAGRDYELTPYLEVLKGHVPNGTEPTRKMMEEVEERTEDIRRLRLALRNVASPGWREDLDWLLAYSAQLPDTTRLVGPRNPSLA